MIDKEPSAKKLKDEKASPRNWIGVTLTYGLMAAVLLACGGDFGWWQGWIYSIWLFGIGIGSRILAEKRHPGIMAERGKLGKDQNVKPWDKILAPLMAISITFPLLILAGLDHRFGFEFIIFNEQNGPNFEKKHKFMAAKPYLNVHGPTADHERRTQTTGQNRKGRRHLVPDVGDYRDSGIHGIPFEGVHIE